MITSAGAPPLLIPWGGPLVPAKERVLLSLSIVPQAGGFAAQWFLDGVQVSSHGRRQRPSAAPRQDGSITIGGDQGFKGVVDEFGIYAWDAADDRRRIRTCTPARRRPSTGARLVFADGFDGLYAARRFHDRRQGPACRGIGRPRRRARGFVLPARHAPGRASP